MSGVRKSFVWAGAVALGLFGVVGCGGGGGTSSGITGTGNGASRATGKLSLTVTSTTRAAGGTPVANATVTVVDTGQQGTTDVNGHVEIADVPAGNHACAVQPQGSTTALGSIPVSMPADGSPVAGSLDIQEDANHQPTAATGTFCIDDNNNGQADDQHDRQEIKVDSTGQYAVHNDAQGTTEVHQPDGQTQQFQDQNGNFIDDSQEHGGTSSSTGSK